ncbi:MAG: hypothetical protein Kapaf2KO_16390 [Candidatus Kapaibacteriales bacterium]
MSKYFKQLLAISLFMFILGCESNENPFDPRLDDNGLTDDINNILPDSILQKILDIDMPINYGVNPPNVEGTFIGSPIILKYSTWPKDPERLDFANFVITFSEQDDEELNVKVGYVNGNEIANGIGSFIIGNESNFSVFVEVMIDYNNNIKAQLIQIISGTIVENGIENLHIATFMLDDFGDPENSFLDQGEGRITYDYDGFSERQ